MSKVKTVTLGCRFNFYESEVAKSMIENIAPETDVILINTCAVTHEAERQSKQAVRKAIRKAGNAKVIVTGCAVKSANDYFKTLSEIEIIENEEKSEIGVYADRLGIKEYRNGGIDSVIDEDNELFKNRARAFLQIQNGCDNFCTYCIVPYTRGRCKSLPLDVIINRINHLTSIGFKEVVLSGIDITSYGKDMSDMTLSTVITEILKRTNLERIRISSLDPAGIDDKLLNIITDEPRIMPHIHLSIQSGDNNVLRSMRRRHTREDVIKLCNNIQDSRNDVVFGSDFIAGFPTETEEMLKNTIKLIKEANLTLNHIFPYSPRTGTPASKMIQLPTKIITDRAKMLREVTETQKEKLYQFLIGRTITGMIERNENGISYGKTDSFIPFIIKGIYNPEHILKITVTGYNENGLEVSII